MEEYTLNNFWGGMADSIREQSGAKFEVAKHFDIFSDPKRLIPYKAVSSDNSGLTTTNEIGNFIASGANAYALGRATASNVTKIFDNSGTNHAWVATTGAEATSAGQARPQKLFMKYKGIIIGKRGNFIWTHTLATNTFDESAKATGTGSAVAYTNGIVGKANGFAYIPVNNVLYYFDGSTWGTAAITIPSDENIIGLANYGNYLAILTTASYIYIWDFVKTTADEIVELEDGSYSVLGSIGGVLVAVGQKTTPVGSEMVMSQYAGGTPEVFFRKILPSTVSIVQGVVRQKYGKMYFAVNDTTTGRPYQGIWAVGRRKAGYPLAVTIAMDYLENGGTASNIANFDLDTSDIFIVTEDFKLHKISGSTYATTTPISYLETTKFTAKDEAKPRVVSMMYNPLPTDGVVNLYYKKDAETSWTLIFTDSTDNALSHVTDVIEGDPTIPLPDYQEIQFRLESLGGAEITEFKFKKKENNTMYSVEK